VRYFAIIAFVAGLAWAQADTDSPAPVPAPPQASAAGSQAAALAASQAAMAASIAKQRASVMQQVAALTGKAAPAASSFFTVPWIDTVAALGAPQCDPMPAEQLDKLIEKSSADEGVKADLIRAVISEESGNRPCAVSPKGAEGLMQLMPETAGLFGVGDPFDPQQNVDAGTKLLKQLLAKYGGDVSLTLSAYNAGAGRVDQEGGIPSIPETINYVKDILAKLVKP